MIRVLVSGFSLRAGHSPRASRVFTSPSSAKNESARSGLGSAQQASLSQRENNYHARSTLHLERTKRVRTSVFTARLAEAGVGTYP